MLNTTLHQNGQPIAKINAVHKGPSANKGSSDDAGGLEPVIHLAHGARVMLISNLWEESRLVNGSMGTVQAICYPTGGPPTLPTAVMVQFDLTQVQYSQMVMFPLCPLDVHGQIVVKPALDCKFPLNQHGQSQSIRHKDLLLTRL